MRPSVVVIFGMSIISEPSLGVESFTISEKFWPPSLEKRMLMYKQLIGEFWVFATSQVTATCSLPSNVLAAVGALTINGPAYWCEVTVMSSWLKPLVPERTVKRNFKSRDVVGKRSPVCLVKLFSKMASNAGI